MFYHLEITELVLYIAPFKSIITNELYNVCIDSEVILFQLSKYSLKQYIPG